MSQESQISLELNGLKVGAKNEPPPPIPTLFHEVGIWAFAALAKIATLAKPKTENLFLLMNTFRLFSDFFKIVGRFQGELSLMERSNTVTNEDFGQSGTYDPVSSRLTG